MLNKTRRKSCRGAVTVDGMITVATRRSSSEPFRFSGWALWVLAAFLPTPALAAGTAYVSAWDTLYWLDLGSAQARAIGSGIGFNDIEGLALAPDGTLYGVADGTIGSGSQQTDFLIRIDPASGAGELVGPLSGLAGAGPNGQLDYGLAFTCDGRLWASSDSTGQLWEIDRNSGAVRLAGFSAAPLSGLAGRDRLLYGIGVQVGFGDVGQQALYRVDPETAQATRIGSLGVAEMLSSSGADFDAEGVLWATLDSQPPDVDRASRLARIDLSTGRAEVIGPISGIAQNVSVRGMAIVAPGSCGTFGGGGMRAQLMPVPGPGLPALGLLGLGVMLIARGRMRSAVSG